MEVGKILSLKCFHKAVIGVRSTGLSTRGKVSGNLLARRKHRPRRSRHRLLVRQQLARIRQCIQRTMCPTGIGVDAQLSRRRLLATDG
ncbi:TPA: hypothetical protein ACG4M2_003816, partial [Stenotrophomonas maltophilia]